MRIGFALASIAALAFSQSALAQDSGFSYLEADYLSTDIENEIFRSEGDGVGLQAAFAFSPRVHGYAEYTNQDFDFDIDFETFELGVGLSYETSPSVDVFGRVGFASADVEVVDDSGFALQGGLRGRLSERFELEGLLHYTDFDDFGASTTFRVNGRFFFSPALALNAGAEADDDTTIWMAGLRYNFVK